MKREKKRKKEDLGGKPNENKEKREKEKTGGKRRQEDKQNI